jgi:predicted phosphodiesterase
MKPKRFIVVSDIHGENYDPYAVGSVMSFLKDFRPEVRVIAGDLWDFAAIRRGATDEERSQSMAADFATGKKFAEEFFSGGKENHLMLGNHDVRAHDLARSTDATKRDLGERMVEDIKAMAKRTRAKTWPYDSRYGVLELGHLKVVHGYHTGAAACANHSRIYGNVIFGHVHSIESFQTPGLKQQEARAIGCLCRLDMDYADRKTGKLRWAHGFAYGWLFSDGTYQLHQARFIEGKCYASTEIKAY